MVKDSKKIRSRTGYVPSDANLYDRMTVMDFLKFGAAFYGAEKDEKRIKNLLDIFNLDPGRKIPELSMGNKKKVSITQAMIHRPELLIFDEPTSGLDPLIQSRFFGTLGLFISVMMKRAKPVTFSCVGLTLILYFLYTISRLPGVDGIFGYISPFKWVNIAVLSPGYGIEFTRVAVFLGMTALLILVSGLIYQRKDILT
ncbi:MAG: ATP-binding cassette domain-containing protein [Bacteroidales bacterium]|nr:ATP-binding cassette domain-containing protein [Bacteroidales bacterium]